MGVPSLGDNESARIREDVRRRKGELVELLKLGKALVIVVPPPQRCYLQTGRKEYSGTGRNRHTTNIIEPMDLGTALPFKVATAKAQGSQIEFRGQDPFGTFWRAHSEGFR